MRTVIAWLMFGYAATGAGAAEFQPALVGNGPKALVNLIDTQKLMQQGQGDAVVMFERIVFPGLRDSDVSQLYGSTTGAEAFHKELRKKLDHAEFLPAMAHGKPVAVLFSGAAVFSTEGGKPHLHIFANQDPHELAKQSDFVAPQLIWGTDNEAAAKNELAAAITRRRNGAVQLSIGVDTSGNVTGLKVLSEDPPGLNFGRAAVARLTGAKFIPGFRDGKLVACTFTSTSYFYFSGYWRAMIGRVR